MSDVPRWVEVFAAQDEADPPDPIPGAIDKKGVRAQEVGDDRFCCSVQSIRMRPYAYEIGGNVQPAWKGYKGGGGMWAGTVIDGESDWVCPTWTYEHTTDTRLKDGGDFGMSFGDAWHAQSLADAARYKEIEPGDTVRIGTAASGFTEYATVLEVRRLAELWNGTSDDLPIRQHCHQGGIKYDLDDTGNDQWTDHVLAARAYNNGVGINGYYPSSLFDGFTYLKDAIPGVFMRAPADKHAAADVESHDAIYSRVCFYKPESDVWLCTGIADKALRLDKRLNCTALPPGQYYNWYRSHFAKQAGPSSYGPDREANVAHRHLAIWGLPDDYPAGNGGEDGAMVVHQLIGNIQYDGEYGDTPGKRFHPIPEMYRYYPLFAQKKTPTILRVPLDHGVKDVLSLKLVGYALRQLRCSGIESSHEFRSDDYLLLRIREVEGTVLSSNRFARGAFAVLYLGDSSNRSKGAVEFSRFDPDGIVVQNASSSTSSGLRSLTVDVFDSQGRPAHVGKLQLWFKLLVRHG